MKDRLVVILFVGILLFGGFFSFFGKREEFSLLERRKLMTSETLQKDFFGNLDTYLQDHFVIRDFLLSASSWYERSILQNHGYRDVFIQNHSLIEKSKSFDEKKILGFANKLEYIYQNFLKENRVFYTLIPDKASFLESKYPKIDYDLLYEMVDSKVSIPYIDITSLFSLEDYFQTDIHLKQSAYFKVIEKWSEFLDFPYYSLPYQEKSYFPFFGVTLSKVPSHSLKDSLIFYDLPSFQNVLVHHLEFGTKPVYDMDKLQGWDAYEVFLSGASALIEITNPESFTNKELILFRDSFGSSFTPLLIPYYQKITVIDLRYIPLTQVVPLFSTSSDVLFSYSTLLVLDSQLLKVSIS